MPSNIELKLAEAEIHYQKQLNAGLNGLIYRHAAALKRVKGLHNRDKDTNTCNHCLQVYPCETINAIVGTNV